jgi:hypothetical protein
MAEVQFKIRGDDSDLDRMSNKVREFEHNLTGAFKRTGDIRAGGALEGFIQNLTSGNVPGAIESIATKLTGLGLLGGVAFGSIAFAVQEGQKEIGKLNEAMGQLDIDRFTGGLEGARAVFKDLAPIADELEHPFNHLLTTISLSGSAIDNMKVAQIASQKDIIQGLNEEASKREGIAELARLTASGADAEATNLKGLLTAQEKITQSKKEEAELYALIDKIAPPGTAGRDALTHAAQRFGERGRAAATDEFAAQQDAIPIGAARRLFESAGVSRDELLSAGQLAGNSGLQFRNRQSFPVALQGDAYMAGLAQRTRAYGEQFRTAGFRREAAGIFSQADDIEGHIGSLRDAEKAPEYQFKNALDSSKILGEISSRLDQINNSVKGISFKNS